MLLFTMHLLTRAVIFVHCGYFSTIVVIFLNPTGRKTSTVIFLNRSHDSLVISPGVMIPWSCMHQEFSKLQGIANAFYATETYFMLFLEDARFSKAPVLARRK